MRYAIGCRLSVLRTVGRALNRFRIPFRHRETRLLRTSPLLTYSNSLDDSYLHQQAQISFEFIGERIAQLGFHGYQRVLDAGCGFGQWTTALGTVNRSAVGLDPSSQRIQIARQIADHDGSGVDVDFIEGRIEDVEFSDGEFDAIFCFGVFMFLEPKSTLEKFKRWLRPGGVLYLCTNSHGWWAYLLLVRGWRSWTMLKSTLGSLCRGDRGIPSAFSPKKLRSLLESSGFSNIQVDLEGHVSKSDDAMNTYMSRFFGLPVCVEALARKPGDLSHEKRSTTETRVNRHVREKCGPSIELAILDGFYKGLQFPIANTGFRKQNSFRDTVVSLHHRVGSMLFHDIQHQPLKIDGAIPDNSYLNLQLRSGRCGVKARVLADWLVELGFVAGTVHTGSHVLTFVEYIDDLLILDCDMYAPGRIPWKSTGTPPTLEDYISNSPLLDTVLNSVHLVLAKNLREARPAHFPVPSTLGNSKDGEIVLLQRINGRDLFWGSRKVSRKSVELVPFPPKILESRNYVSPTNAYSYDQHVLVTLPAEYLEEEIIDPRKVALEHWTLSGQRQDNGDRLSATDPRNSYLAYVHSEHWLRNRASLIPGSSIARGDFTAVLENLDEQPLE